ncbi:MAG TPA: hypothetical protein VFU47_01415 [Armatimonadota bacterium]|nr:hypothetical protein [Armatimonadota bacterium]
MFHPRQDSWADILLWGATTAILLLFVAAAIVTRLNLWSALMG